MKSTASLRCCFAQEVRDLDENQPWGSKSTPGFLFWLSSPTLVVLIIYYIQKWYIRSGPVWSFGPTTELLLTLRTHFYF